MDRANPLGWRRHSQKLWGKRAFCFRRPKTTPFAPRSYHYWQAR